MESVTVPRSFDDTIPAEMMKAIQRRPNPSPSRAPILDEQDQHRSYSSVIPTQAESEGQEIAENDARAQDEVSERETTSHEEHRRQWIGSRIWEGIKEWERDNVEMVLENKQSVARDHLGKFQICFLTPANERTYLAWLRTSLSFASIGVAITQLFRLSTTLQPQNPPAGFDKLRRLGRPLGATFIGIAVLVLALGVQRYFIQELA
jgi:hypothetical protein